jgi:hypothetical protein
MASGESSLKKGVGSVDLAKSGEGNGFGYQRRGQKASGQLGEVVWRVGVKRGESCRRNRRGEAPVAFAPKQRKKSERKWGSAQAHG